MGDLCVAMISQGNPPDMLVVRAEPNESQAPTRLDISNELSAYITRTSNKSQIQSNKPPLEAAIVLNVKCDCGIGEDNAVCASQGLYCTHSVHCYELPMKFSFLPITSAGLSGEATADGKYLADQKRWWPPPVFIIFISLLEVGVFIYDYITVKPHSKLSSTSIPSESLLIYRPDRRLEIWRFLTYMTLHANCFHLAFNVIVQLLYGLPLELVHGSARIAAIYMAGVLAGSLGTSVIDSEVYLVGASGGVYALLAAHLANVMINFGQMRYGASQLMALLIFVFCDTGYAFYIKYIAEQGMFLIPSVSYIAHLTGSLAGFSIGLLVLINFEHETKSNLIRWLAFGVYATFTLFAIAFNLVNTITAQKLEEEGELFSKHLLHNLGIS
ncbi:protein rhomboid [Stomoxys calcitrans]|uniref:protein rhomboid n=1 Tax=Stomoxys calcitrans TaxID=35570 RepID=UPI0027E2E2F9|nr:protein rhomboid [Stomoxys calcitrans]XP_059216509.1 protein rhomboid [Stomoxys calcitrans]XP_059216510.1 protein rhomboid [Stomoxys calcitrans]XP_059216511.1 protein rhomboid [Stomoxys calcitrans]